MCSTWQNIFFLFFVNINSYNLITVIVEDTPDPTPGVSFTEYFQRSEEFSRGKNMIRAQVDGGQIGECQFSTSLT